MHSRNPYRDSPDFSALAEAYPPLKKFVFLSSSGKPAINFQDSGAQRTLTQALLKRDFNLTISLPEDRLCPTVPNRLVNLPHNLSHTTFIWKYDERLNYILWLQDILSPLDPTVSNERVRGLDIGTGASAIYPILACSLPSTSAWEFVGTEIDPLSATVASQNVEANNLSSQITIWPVAQPQQKTSIPPILAPLLEDPEATFDFTMCNPPFYGSAAEIESSAEGKELPPNAVCTGAETEMITPGGEAAFVLQILRESAQEDVRSRCRYLLWFTSMLGKLSSVGAVVEELRKLGIENYALTQFIQGTTRRWAVGWSFSEERLPDSLARPTSSSLAPYVPAPTTLQQKFTISPQEVIHSGLIATPKLPDALLWSTLTQVLASIEGLTVHEVSSRVDVSVGDGARKIDMQAKENTWSRAARRKRKRSISPSAGRAGKMIRLDSTSWHAATATPDDKIGIPDIPARAALQCQIWVLPATPEDPSRSDSEARSVQLQARLEAQWVRGTDRALFEGFWSHICRKIKDRLEGKSVGAG